MLELHGAEQSNRFRLRVSEDQAVGPLRHVFLFGDVGHAAAAEAMKRAIGREPIWSTAQFTCWFHASGGNCKWTYLDTRPSIGCYTELRYVDGVALEAFENFRDGRSDHFIQVRRPREIAKHII